MFIIHPSIPYIAVNRGSRSWSPSVGCGLSFAHFRWKLSTLDLIHATTCVPSPYITSIHTVLGMEKLTLYMYKDRFTQISFSFSIKAFVSFWKQKAGGENYERRRRLWSQVWMKWIRIYYIKQGCPLKRLLPSFVQECLGKLKRDGRLSGQIALRIKRIALCYTCSYVYRNSLPKRETSFKGVVLRVKLENCVNSSEHKKIDLQIKNTNLFSKWMNDKKKSKRTESDAMWERKKRILNRRRNSHWNFFLVSFSLSEERKSVNIFKVVELNDDDDVSLYN